VKDTEEMRKNKNHMQTMDDALRLLIFIEVVNTVKVLIMQNIEFLRSNSKKYHCIIASCIKQLQNIEFLRSNSKKYHCIIASCIKQLQIILNVDVVSVLTSVVNETDPNQQLKNVDFIFMVCLPLYFLANQTLKEG